MKPTMAILAVACAFLASTVYVTVSAQTTKSVNDGVYTAAQAKRGEPVYRENCAGCHGDDLKGSGPMPPLAGDEFVSAWKGKTVWELFEKTHVTMPATAPGSLTEPQAADILAYMFSAEKYPEGTTELDTKKDVLSQITIDAPK